MWKYLVGGCGAQEHGHFAADTVQKLGKGDGPSVTQERHLVTSQNAELTVDDFRHNSPPRGEKFSSGSHSRAT